MRPFLYERAAAVLHDDGPEARVSAAQLRPGHFAIVMLGTPTRDTSLTVI